MGGARERNERWEREVVAAESGVEASATIGTTAVAAIVAAVGMEEERDEVGWVGDVDRQAGMVVPGEEAEEERVEEGRAIAYAASCLSSGAAAPIPTTTTSSTFFLVLVFIVVSHVPVERSGGGEVEAEDDDDGNEDEDEEGEEEEGGESAAVAAATAAVFTRDGSTSPVLNATLATPRSSGSSSFGTDVPAVGHAAVEEAEACAGGVEHLSRVDPIGVVVIPPPRAAVSVPCVALASTTPPCRWARRFQEAEGDDKVVADAMGAVGVS